MNNRAGRKAIGVIAAGVMAGAAGVAASLKATKRIQDKARAEGRHVPYGPYEALFKRPLDVVLSTGALVVLSPVMAATAVAVRVKLGSPVIFTQERPGLNERPFVIYKFRTMTNELNGKGQALSDDARITRFGKAIRSASIDELPELVNIIKGDMAVVGPRPLLMAYLPYYSEEERRRHDILPGLSGLAQVSGRNAIRSWEERFRYDLEYVSKVTFIGDVRIIALTAIRVAKRSGVQVGSEIKVGRLDTARSESVD